MTRVIGITGGMGSGKTTVCKIFESLGVPVFYADDVAKQLYGEASIQEQVISVFGKNVFVNGALNRAYLANLVFKDSEKLQRLNAIIHPAVSEKFEAWKRKQSSDWVLKEAAILIESGGADYCDEIVLVRASEAERVKRITKRDGVDVESVLARMKSQMNDEERMKYVDHVVDNSGVKMLIPQVLELYDLLSKI